MLRIENCGASLRGCSQSSACRKLWHEKEIPDIVPVCLQCPQGVGLVPVREPFR